MAQYDSRLVEYAMGTLAPESVAELERALRSSARLREELAAAFAALDRLDEVEPMQPSAAVRDRLFASIDAETPYAGLVPRLAALFDLGEARIRQLLSHVHALGDRPWASSGLAGIQLLHFAGGPRVASADCGLVHMAAGASFPAHRHRGDEWALVLDGELAEDDGRRYRTGDIAYKPAGSQHCVAVPGRAPAIFAVVNHDGLDFIG